MKFVYLILLIISAAFHIMYKGDLSFALLAFMIVFPIMLFIGLAINTLRMKTAVYCEYPSAEKGRPLVLKVRLENRSFLPVSSCVIGVSYRTAVPFEKSVLRKHTISVPLGAGAAETISVSFVPKHCGTVEIMLKNIVVYDLIGLASMRKRVGFHKKMTVQPVIYPIAADMESSIVFNAESDVFSPEKAGDDPSEIFSLREYRDGDNPNRIHWKLSSRTDDFIVKELSMPVGSRILVMADFGGCGSAECCDRILETAFSISDFLTSKGAVHSAAFPYNDCTVHVSEINDRESFDYEINRASDDAVNFEFKSGIAAIAAASEEIFRISGGGFSRVIAVTARTGKAHTEELAEFCGEARLTIICVNPPQESNDNEDIVSAEIIYADAEKLSADAGEFLI